MSFTAEIVKSESEAVEAARKASSSSFEAWLPQFPGLYKPKGIDDLMGFDEFVFKFVRNRANCLKYMLNLLETIEVYGNERQKILVSNRKRTLMHPFTPPIFALDTENSKILTIESLTECICNFESGEVQIGSSTGSIGLIRQSTSNGIKTYDVFDSYSQPTFYVTPNLAPHQGLQLLILGAERSFLTAAVFQREDDYTLEIFKPISTMLKALLVSITLYVIHSNGDSYSY